MVQSLKAQEKNMLHIILVYLIYACSLWFICSQSKREFLKNGIRAKDCRICRKSQ